jgi:short subunit dehydrogenase-like uncharacterized protein
MIELAHHGLLVRRDGRLEHERMKTLMVDFGRGPRHASLLTWGDVFTAYRSTGIPNIEVYASKNAVARIQMLAVAYARPLFKPRVVRKLLQRTVTRGSTQEERARTSAHVWGKVEDDQGRSVVSRLHGPEAAVDWTARAALRGIPDAGTGVRRGLCAGRAGRHARGPMSRECSAAESHNVRDVS